MLPGVIYAYQGALRPELRSLTGKECDHRSVLADLIGVGTFECGDVKGHLELQIMNTRKNPRRKPGEQGSSNEDRTTTRGKPKPPEGKDERHKRQSHPASADARAPGGSLGEDRGTGSESEAEANEERGEEKREHETRAENTR